MNMWKVLVVTVALAILGSPAVARDATAINNKPVYPADSRVANKIKPEDPSSICFWFQNQWICF